MQLSQNLSHWEYHSWFANVDFTVVGSGITGLSCAIELRKKHPKAKIIVLERGPLPQGASTKNAGFACFGSLSELISDLKSHSEDELLNLVEKRLNGLSLLRKNFGDAAIGYKQYGGYELFFDRNQEMFETCLEKREQINDFLKPIFKKPIFESVAKLFSFGGIREKVIYNKVEGQLDTGMLMQALLRQAYKNDILVINNCTVNSFEDTGSVIQLQTTLTDFTTRKLLLATNGFSEKLGIEKVQAARSQVLITQPIKDLKIKGTFHLDEGYMYFRNVEDRILLGGGRNINKDPETTDTLGTTAVIQDYLEKILAETILPNQEFQIERRWSGILGVGDKMKPIVERVSENVFCGVRLGGMGVAIGSLVGQELADLLD